jgi:hypothetical protein
MKIPIIINNRNLLTWPKAMLEEIQRFDHVGDIWIVDNASTYEPLLEWMETKPCEILRLDQNIGHVAPWSSGLVNRIGIGYYVVTDGDLGLEGVKSDVLQMMYDKLEFNPPLEKVGLGLEWRTVKNTSPYFKHMLNYEHPRWRNSHVIDDVYIDVPVDTTFAMYNRNQYFIGGGSLSYPYVARHYPWEIIDINENEEFKFYIENANTSSSYKTFLRL